MASSFVEMVGNDAFDTDDLLFFAVLAAGASGNTPSASGSSSACHSTSYLLAIDVRYFVTCADAVVSFQKNKIKINNFNTIKLHLNINQ